MDDDRIWAFEESLWTGDACTYRTLVDDECVMVLPATPFVFQAEEAIAAVADTPRWTKVALTERRVQRPQEGLIVIAYRARASRDAGAPYTAYCTSTLRRLEHDEWRVVQHQQTLPPTATVTEGDDDGSS